MELNSSLKLDQKLSLSPSQLQSLEVLAMCNADLKSFLENEYNENPLLEQKEGRKSGSLSVYEGRNLFSFSGGSTENGDEHQRFLENIPAAERKTAEEYFAEQLDLRHMDKETERICRFLIQNVDAGGYYTLSISETAFLVGCKKEDVIECLELLRTLEPAGCFWRTLEDCLLAQIAYMGASDKILDQIIRENLEDLGKGKLSVITRKYDITTARARQYKQLLSKLNPRPLLSFTGEDTVEYLVPDVLITLRDGELEAELNDSWIGNYGLNDFYLKMVETCQDENLKEYFSNKLERARFVLNAIEQRRRTILRIAQAIIKRQKDYLTGTGFLAPMTMKDIAEELSVSPSTVGRAVGGKYVQYPAGIASFKTLFLQNVSSNPEAAGNTADEIKNIIRKIVAEENPDSPLSDSAIVRKLSEKGISLSRRAVAKYRMECGIPGSFDRR